MIKYGTNYGGWFIPRDINLNENSIVYSVGVGEDISFDIILQSKYNCNIILIDPTEKAIKHYNECKKFFKDKTFKFTGNIQFDYYDKIKNENPNMDKIKYINIGLWNKKDKLKFYKQSNKDYVSQSFIEGMFSNEYDEVEVDTLDNILKLNNHQQCDLLKMDIEGAENIVLNNMLDNKIYPTYLCIEFDLYLKNKDFKNTTREIVDRLYENNYKVLANDNYNITFIRTN